jgi:WD40 repeat protein
MRLPSVTGRTTWLLAAAAWVGLSAMTWQLLPPRPWAVTGLSGPHLVLGVGPGGRTVAMVGLGDAPGDRVPVRVWDTGVGSIQTVVPDQDVMAGCRLSPDGRWLAAGVGPADSNGNVNRVRIIDVASGEADELAGGSRTYDLMMPWMGSRGWAVFSPDSRWLFVVERNDGGPEGLRLWNVTGRRAGPFLTGAHTPFAFSPDGRCFAAMADSQDAVDDARRDCVVWDNATGRELARLRKPLFDTIEELTLDNSGIIVGHCTGPATGLGDTTPHRFVCLNLADGRERWSVEDVQRFVPIDGGRRIMAHRHTPAGVNDVIILDTADGRTVGQVPLADDDCLEDAAPDARTLLICSSRQIGLEAVWAWLERHGLPGPRPAWNYHSELLDTATGRRLLVPRFVDGTSAAFSPDGQSLVAGAISQAGSGAAGETPIGAADEVAVWDLPPRRSVTWLLFVALVLALPIVWLANRRNRRRAGPAGELPDKDRLR